MSSGSSSNPSTTPASSSSSPTPPAPNSQSTQTPPAASGSGVQSSSSPTPPASSGQNNGEKSQSPPEFSQLTPSRSGDDQLRSKLPQLGDGSGKRDDSLNQTAMAVGVASGAALLLTIMILFIFYCCRKKKRTKSDQELQYYRNNNNPLENPNNYYMNPPSGEYLVKIPPGAPGSGGLSSEYGWNPGPPPPPPNMSSGEMNSGGFPGPYHMGMAPSPQPALGLNQSSFTYEDLMAATGGFAQANLLGQGGFGFVHRGVLPNGKVVAVKSLKSNSGQGDREFHAEVDIISRVHHRHLVSLVGYCTTGAQRLLVYEFVNNGTLEDHLHGAGRPTMDWRTRHQIALGAAKGFAYLHEDCHPRIIHRDIKAANILLDSNFEAKVADFGLAKLSNDNLTHVSTRIMGTFGYLAPEYASSGKLTEKSDVYSFGIMLLELITGRRPMEICNDDDSLVDWARPILMKVQEGGSYEELVDSKLGDNYDPNEMLHMVACAGACIRHSARGRPKMSQIVRALEGDVSLDDLNNGAKRASAQMSSTDGSDSDLRRFARSALSQEYSSSEEFNSRN